MKPLDKTFTYWRDNRTEQNFPVLKSVLEFFGIYNGSEQYFGIALFL